MNLDGVPGPSEYEELRGLAGLAAAIPPFAKLLLVLVYALSALCLCLSLSLSLSRCLFILFVIVLVSAAEKLQTYNTF